MNGVGKVLLFNWPRYTAALTAAGAGALLPVPRRLRPAVRVGSGAGLGWIATSLAATWWAYDHKPLYDWQWVTELLPNDPARYAVISTGLDEISPVLRRRYPEAERLLIDLHDRRWTGGGSIGRARAFVPPEPGAHPASPGQLPARTASLDAVFLVFAAHELRHASQRGSLFREIARVLRTEGSLLLVEHCRDLANMSVYGPGAWHFYPRREWLRLAREAGLHLTAETSMTPLVRAWAFRA